MSATDYLKLFFKKTEHSIKEEVIPFIQHAYNYLETKVLKINEIQKDFDFSTNFIFFTIVFISLYVLLKIVFGIKNTIFRTIDNIIFSIRTRRNMKKIENLKKEVDQYLVPMNKLHKYKPILEFRDIGYKVEEVTKEVRRAWEKDQVNVPSDINKMSGKVFNISNEKDLKTVNYQANKYFGYSNLLHADIYTSCRFIESELIKNLLGFFNGNSIDNCGITTFNTTESLILVLLAYREMKQASDPEIMISEGCPAIYYKITQMLNIKMRFIPIDETGSIRIENFKNMLKKNKSNIICTIGLYPNPCFGNEDNTEELSKICLREDIPLHVDASYGGFMAAFSRDHTLFPKFDFQLPGVSSISVNMSYFAKCPIGICFVGYRSRDIRKHHFFTYGKWMGGLYCSPTLPGSRVGSVVISAYVTFLSLGLGNLKAFSKIQYELINDLKKQITDRLPRLSVIGNPGFNLISITSIDLPLIAIYEKMKEKSWDLTLRFKNEEKLKIQEKMNAKNGKNRYHIDNALCVDSINLLITSNNIETVAEKFIDELEECYKFVQSTTPKNYRELQNYPEPKEVSTLRKVSQLPAHLQNDVLNNFVSSKLEFK